MRGAVVAALALAGCGGGVSQAERQQALSAARAGMDKVRALPGGKQATFTAVRLVNGEAVCGTIDGNDGIGPRGFAVTGGEVLLADPRDVATARPLEAPCRGPSRDITSRNAQFSDIDVGE